MGYHLVSDPPADDWFASFLWRYVIQIQIVAGCTYGSVFLFIRFELTAAHIVWVSRFFTFFVELYWLFFCPLSTEK